MARIDYEYTLQIIPHVRAAADNYSYQVIFQHLFFSSCFVPVSLKQEKPLLH